MSFSNPAGTFEWCFEAERVNAWVAEQGGGAAWPGVGCESPAALARSTWTRPAGCMRFPAISASAFSRVPVVTSRIVDIPGRNTSSASVTSSRIPWAWALS